MKPNELRIGNYVYADDNVIVKIARIESEQYAEWNSGNDFCIISQDKSGENDYYEDMVNPIPLTEEWLLKCGFNGNINETSNCGNFYLGYDAEYGMHKMSIWYQRGSWCFNNTNQYTVLKYVHQLQNLYFALRGEELVFSTEP